MLSKLQALGVSTISAVRRTLGLTHSWDRTFEVYIILAPPNCPPLWYWDHWQPMNAIITPLLETLPGIPTIETWQDRETGKNWIRSTPKPWSKRTHQNWTHYSPSKAVSNEDRRFQSMQAWLPSREICNETDQAPEVFFCLENILWPATSKVGGKFNQLILFAIDSRLSTITREAQASAVNSIAIQTKGVLVVHSRRPWAIRSPLGAGYHLALWNPSLLFKQGAPLLHERTISPDLLEGSWEQVAIGQ